MSGIVDTSVDWNMECRTDREDLMAAGLARNPVDRIGESHLVVPGSSRPPVIQVELWPRTWSAEGTE